MVTNSVNLQKIREAQTRIADLVVTTPLKPAYELSHRLGKSVFFKLETTQPTGAFKLRGAANALLSLNPQQAASGVITLSSGNHGRAMAYVARALGIRAVIGVADQVPEVKIEAIRRLGAEVMVIDMDQNGATQHLREFAAEHGLTYISPFDHPDVICGQGTIALEILTQNPNIDTLVIPLSGGGLLAGMAAAAKQIKPDIRIIGVSQEQGACIHESIRAGRIVEVEETPSLADALLGGIPIDNQYSFELCRRLIDHTILLDEKAIGRAMSFGFRHEHLVLEGGGAVALGALLKHPESSLFGEQIAAICSGDNVAPDLLLNQINAYPDP